MRGVQGRARQFVWNCSSSRKPVLSQSCSLLCHSSLGFQSPSNVLDDSFDLCLQQRSQDVNFSRERKWQNGAGVIPHLLSLRVFQMSTEKIRKRQAEPHVFLDTLSELPTDAYFQKWDGFVCLPHFQGVFLGVCLTIFKRTNCQKEDHEQFFLADEERKGHTDDGARVAQVPLLSLFQVI